MLQIFNFALFWHPQFCPRPPTKEVGHPFFRINKLSIIHFWGPFSLKKGEAITQGAKLNYEKKAAMFELIGLLYLKYRSHGFWNQKLNPVTNKPHTCKLKLGSTLTWTNEAMSLNRKRSITGRGNKRSFAKGGGEAAPVCIGPLLPHRPHIMTIWIPPANDISDELMILLLVQSLSIFHIWGHQERWGRIWLKTHFRTFAGKRGVNLISNH